MVLILHEVNGKEMRKIPLHTLKATIDYTHQRAETIYGVIGIKVWLFIK
jgi:ribosomal protein S3